MYIGHFGVGFGAKAAAGRAALGTLFLSAQFLDLLWPSLLLLGIEEVRIAPGITTVTPLEFVRYPVSHGLMAVVLWATLLAVVYQLVRRYTAGALAVWLLVVSHWVLDFITHRPDLPLYPGSRLVGLELWASMPATVIVESVLFGIGLWLYQRATVAMDRVGRFALWGLVVFLLGTYAANLLGPPPPSSTAVAVVGQGQWLLIAWAYWVDRHRAPR
jgi:hypothetical protein